MQICGFGWENYVLTGTLSSDDSVRNLPISNLTTPHGAPAQGWRTRGKTASFLIKLGAGQVGEWEIISFHRTNFSSNFQIKLTIFRGSETVLSTEWQAGTCRGGQAVFVFEKTVGDGLKIEINDTNNSDNFLSIPLCFAGSLWRPERNFSSQSSRTVQVGEQVTTTLSGAEFVEPYYTQRVATISHQSLGDRDLLTVNEIARRGAADKNILFVPDPGTDSHALSETAVFGRFSMSDISNPYGVADRHGITFTVRERL